MDELYDVAIIGSGPAGLTAAIYTTRGSASTVLFTGTKWGGQLMLTTLVENYPGFPDGIQGPDLMFAMKKQAEKFGAKVVSEDITEVDFGTKPFTLKVGKTSYKAKSVIIATGAKTVWLGVSGEEKLIGRGISSCAPCDAPFFREKKVAVIGGGDSAMEEALVLEKFAKEITIIHRRDEFRASKIMQKKVLASPKIKVMYDTEVQGVIGENKLEKIILKNNKTNKESEMEVDGMFVAVGHTPSSTVFKGKIELDEKGFIKKAEKEGYKSSTSIEGVFVAGDVHDFHFKQAITAAGFGCMAALDVLKYLEA
ncbi:MAG TPA: thioredoxin-disulfide reductase [Candidatus Saccharimonadales bacterium]|nr:thioredoxin-disulfide reductase [Candidatus Saccharimonadales bacterium]